MPSYPTRATARPLPNHPRDPYIPLGVLSGWKGVLRGCCRVPRNRVSQNRPTTSFWPICGLDLCRETQQGGVADQAFCRATQRGVADQVPARQPYETERTTKSLLSNPARWSGQPNLSLATLWWNQRDYSSLSATVSP